MLACSGIGTLTSSVYLKYLADFLELLILNRHRRHNTPMVCLETQAVCILKTQVLLFVYSYETGSYSAALAGLEYIEIFLPLSAEC